MHYLSLEAFPDNEIEAHKIQVQVARFFLMNGQLYKRSLDRPSLKRLNPQQGQYILAELHEGICGNHLSYRTLAHMAHTQGYYWPTMRANATASVKKCDAPKSGGPLITHQPLDIV